MKTGKYYLVLVVLAWIVSPPALGGVDLPQVDNPVVLVEVNPTLAGIEAVVVSVHGPGTSQYKAWKGLEIKVTKKLKQAGIKAIPAALSSTMLGHRLSIGIDMLKLTDYHLYVFRIQASVEVTYLPKDSTEPVKLELWEAEPVMETVPVEAMPDTVTNVVLEQVETFIHAYLAANPPNKQPSDVKTSDTVSQTSQKEQTRPIAKPPAAKHKYVASKNSKVFHKSECIWAGRIKPENLTGYNSRAEAIKAGKRPCKQCKP
jgi:hypothetical protein